MTREIIEETCKKNMNYLEEIIKTVKDENSEEEIREVFIDYLMTVDTATKEDAIEAINLSFSYLTKENRDFGISVLDNIVWLVKNWLFAVKVKLEAEL